MFFTKLQLFPYAKLPKACFTDNQAALSCRDVLETEQAANFVRLTAL